MYLLAIPVEKFRLKTKSEKLNRSKLTTGFTKRKPLPTTICFLKRMELRQSRSRPFDQAEIVQLSSLVFYKEKKVLLMFNLKPRKRAFRVEQDSS